MMKTWLDSLLSDEPDLIISDIFKINPSIL